jgi:hypothetical protein
MEYTSNNRNFYAQRYILCDHSIVLLVEIEQGKTTEGLAISIHVPRINLNELRLVIVHLNFTHIRH